MSDDAQLYSLVYVTVLGALLTEESSMTMNRSANAQPVVTVAKGWAGVSPGAPTLQIQIENAIPSAAFELNPGPFIQNLELVEVGLLCAGKQLTAKGFILDDSIKHGANTEAGLSFTFHGAFADFE